MPLGAGVWDNIGTYTFSNVIRFNSGGGDLKVCATSTSQVINFGIKRSFFGGLMTATSTGGLSNCAIWRGIGDAGYVDLTWADDMHPSSVTVTVYD